MKKIKKILIPLAVVLTFSAVKVDALNKLDYKQNKFLDIYKVADKCNNSSTTNANIISELYSNTTFTTSSMIIKLPDKYKTYYAEYSGQQYNSISNIITIPTITKQTAVDIYSDKGCKIGYITYSGNCIEDYKNIVQDLNIESSFSDSTGNYTINVGNNKNNYKIEFTYTDTNDNEKTLKTINGNGSVSVNYNSSYDEVIVKIYDNNNSSYCNNKQIGYYSISIPTMKKNNLKNSASCKINEGDYPELKKTIPECVYNYYNEIQSNFTTNENTLKEKIDNAKKIYDAEIKISSITSQTVVKPPNSLTKDSKTTCSFNQDDNNKTVNYWYEKIGTYIDLKCVETIEYEYSSPKYANVGGGFEYQVVLKPTVSCQIVQKKKPVKKTTDICKYSTSCWGGVLNLQGTSGAGPNEDFDSCIQKCDGGKYSQKCINSCYNKVYKNNALQTNNAIQDTTSLLRKLSETDNTKNCKGTDISHKKGSCSGNSYLFSGHKGCGQYYCISDGTTNVMRFFHGDSCQATCNVVITNSRGASKKVTLNGSTSSSFRINASNAYSSLGCTNSVLASKNKTEYNTEMDKYTSELANATAKAKQLNSNTTKSDLEKYYRENNTQFVYEITNNNETYYFTSDGKEYNGKKSIGTLETIYGDKQTITLKIPDSYLNDGDVKYYGDSALTNDYKSQALMGGNKFYTSLLSKKINKVAYWPYESIKASIIETKGEEYYKNNIQPYLLSNIEKLEKNIKVHIKNSSLINKTEVSYDIECAFGLEKPGKIVDCNDDEISNNNEECSEENDSDNGNYIFRTVDLMNMFPNSDTNKRKIGWNWTNKASRTLDIPYSTKGGNKETIGYEINPEKVIQSFKDLGVINDENNSRNGVNNIYNDRYKEYYSKLTPSNIVSILGNNKDAIYGKYKCTSDSDNFACFSNFINKEDSVVSKNTKLGINRYFGGRNNE